MRYEASLTAYDCIDKVMVSYSLRLRSDNPEEPWETVLRESLLVRGVGQSEPSRWLIDVLVAALETL